MATRKRPVKKEGNEKRVKLNKAQIENMKSLSADMQAARQVAQEAQGRANVYVQGIKDAHGIGEELPYARQDGDELVFTDTVPQQGGPQRVENG